MTNSLKLSKRWKEKPADPTTEEAREFDIGKINSWLANFVDPTIDVHLANFGHSYAFPSFCVPSIRRISIDNLPILGIATKWPTATLCSYRPFFLFWSLLIDSVHYCWAAPAMDAIPWIWVFCFYILIIANNCLFFSSPLGNSASFGHSGAISHTNSYDLILTFIHPRLHDSFTLLMSLIYLSPKYVPLSLFCFLYHPFNLFQSYL